MSVLDRFQNVFKIPELKRRVLFTLGILVVAIGLETFSFRTAIVAWRWTLS